jgi:hypothetical protein
VVALAAMLMVSGLTPASAAVVLSDTGQRGIYVLPDEVTDETRYPGARCGYGPESSGDDALFEWMRFRAPEVYARDTGSGTQHQRVTVIYRLQRDPGTGWRTVASSKQTATAHETEPADISRSKLFFDGRAGDLMRGVVSIKWLRNGEVEGAVKLALEYYSVKWTVGSPDYIYEDACDGSAD